MSQRWATHRSPTYQPLSSGGYARSIIHCNTERFSYPTVDRAYGMCKLHKGKTSYSRCLNCDDNDGESTIKFAEIPAPVREACVYRDTRYDARRQGCKTCLEKTECLSLGLVTKKYRLRVIK